MALTDNLIREAQIVNALKKRLEKLYKDLEDPALTAGVRRSRYASIAAADEKLKLKLHDLHCEAVALGIADYNPKRYGTVTVTNAFGKVSLYFTDPAQPKIPDNVDPTPLEIAIAKEKTGGLDQVSDRTKEKTGSSIIEQLGQLNERVLEAVEEELDKRIKEKREAEGGDLPDDNLEPVDQPTTFEVTITDALEEVVPTKPPTLKDAQKVYQEKGAVLDGFIEVEGRIYKRSKPPASPAPKVEDTVKPVDPSDDLPEGLQIPPSSLV